jgi:hypothetical protein
MPKPREVIGGTENSDFSQATTSRKCVLAVSLTIKLGINKVGNQEQALKDSARIVFWQFKANTQKYGHRTQILSRQQASRRNLAFLIAHVNLNSLVVGFVLKSVAVLLNTCSKLPKYNFSRILQCFSNCLRKSCTN